MWVLSDKDRNSGLQAPTSLPVAYGLKDYKFTASAMQKATESVLVECRERGLRVVLLATDGHWYKDKSEMSSISLLPYTSCRETCGMRLRKFPGQQFLLF